MTAFVNIALPLSPSVNRATLTRSAFSGVRIAPRAERRCSGIVRMAGSLPIFTQAMEDFKADFEPFAKRGWGATVKAERWNGRHAMFGLLVLVITGYCKGHGLLPDPSVHLDLTQWGVLGSLGDGSPIPMERAIILVAHIHVLFVSIAAAIAPFSFQDKLLLEEGEEDEEPAGLIPEFKGGLTKEAEIFNGRVAMLGVCVLVGISFALKMPVLDVLNLGLGNLLF